MNKLVSLKRRKYDSKNSIGKLKHLKSRMLSFKKVRFDNKVRQSKIYIIQKARELQNLSTQNYVMPKSRKLQKLTWQH